MYLILHESSKTKKKNSWFNASVTKSSTDIKIIYDIHDF